MAPNFRRGYRTVSTNETSGLDALSVRALADIEDGINNTLLALSPKLIGQPFIPHVAGGSHGSTEQIALIWGPYQISEIYDVITWTLRHRRTSGSNGVTWRLYSSSWRYPSQVHTFSAQKLGYYSSASIVSSSDTAAISVSERELPIVRDRDPQQGYTWLTLTHQPTVSGTFSEISTLDVTAQINRAY